MHLLKLPRLGQTMESGTITTWYQEQGQEFDEEDLLYEVETDKMTTEVEAKDSGVLLRMLVPENVEVDVGTILAVVGERGATATEDEVERFLEEQGLAGESVARPGADSASGTETSAAADAELGDASSEVSNGTRTVRVSTDDDLDGSSCSNRVDQGDGRVHAVPKARAIAAERGIDLREVSGSGQDGTIRVRDLDNFSGRDSQPGEPRIANRVPLTGVTRAMADSMTRSWTQVPQFVQQISADASALAARLKRLRFEGETVTYTDLLIGAVGAAATEVPEVNASVTDDEIVRYADVNVSVAMASQNGLMVPVVRDAGRLPIGDIARETKRLAQSVDTGKVGIEDSSNGTISLSNLGAYGVDTGTPLVNAPQTATVFVGSIGDQVVAVGGIPVVQLRVNIAVAFDHRSVDGMTAARFTAALKTRIEAGG